jgi:hypothetical protein
MNDDEQFRRMWRIMDIRQKVAILTVAVRGRAADDLSTAWFVVNFTRRVLSRSRTLMFLAVSLGWAIVIAWVWFAYGTVFWGPLIALCVGLPLALFLRHRYRRALRLNIPLAQEPQQQR